MVDWIVLVATTGVGIIGGVASGIVSSMVSKAAVNRRMNIEKENMNKLVDECFGKVKGDLKKRFMKLNKDCCFCQRLIPVNAVVCAFCGKAVAGSMMCPKCEICLPDSAEYCYLCGEGAEKKADDDKKSKQKGKKQKK
jgi:hypothetical protein